MREINLLDIQSKERVYPNITDRQRKILSRFGREYYDDPAFPGGYQGYVYDGRWKQPAQKMAAFFGLQDGAKILDVGCAKGFMLYDFKELNPTFRVHGVDISEYAVENAMPSIRDNLVCRDCVELPYEDSEFDLVLSVDMLHNLDEADCRTALQEINRVGKQHRFIMVHSYRTKKQLENLTSWEATIRLVLSTSGWKRIFLEEEYHGFYWFRIFV